MPNDPVAQLNAIMENMKKINENPMGANQFQTNAFATNATS